MFDWLGTAIAGVGNAIMTGLEWIGTNLISPIVDFVKDIPTMLSEGFGHVAKFVGSIFGGDMAGATEAARSTGAGVVEATKDGAVAAMNDGITLGGFSEALGLGGSGGLMETAGAVAKTTAAAATDIPAAAGGAVTAPVKAVSAAPTDSFGKMVEFFKTDVGQFVGKGAITAAAMLYQRQETKAARKFAQAEAEKQRQEEKRMWALQEQRKSDMTAWEAQRANESAQYAQRNKFAGFGVGWSNPTTAVPAAPQVPGV